MRLTRRCHSSAPESVLKSSRSPAARTTVVLGREGFREQQRCTRVHSPIPVQRRRREVRKPDSVTTMGVVANQHIDMAERAVQAGISPSAAATSPRSPATSTTLAPSPSEARSSARMSARFSEAPYSSESCRRWWWNARDAPIDTSRDATAKPIPRLRLTPVTTAVRPARGNDMDASVSAHSDTSAQLHDGSADPSGVRSAPQAYSSRVSVTQGAE